MKPIKIITLLMLLGACLGSTRAQTLSGKIAYELNGDLRVFYLPNGPDQVLVGTADRTEAHPRLSPDGTQIAYRVGGSEYGVRMRPLNDGLETIITTSPYASWPTWSFDGTKIAWSVIGPSKRNTQNGIWWRSADGTGPEVRRTTHGGKPAFSPADPLWPLEEAIVFTSGRDNPKAEPDLRITASTGSLDDDEKLLSLTGGEGDTDWQPFAVILFNHQDRTTQEFDIFLYDPTQAITSANPRSLHTGTGSDWEPRWMMALDSSGAIVPLVLFRKGGTATGPNPGGFYYLDPNPNSPGSPVKLDFIPAEARYPAWAP